MDIPGNLSTRVLALTAAGGLVASLLVAGCNTSATAAGATAQCPAVPGVTAHQLKYGLLYPATGESAAALGPYRAGVDARLGVANAAGGVNGRTVSYAWADDGSQGQLNLGAAQELVNVNQAFAIQEFSTTPQGSAPWLNSQGIPVVGTSNNVVWTKYSNMFSYYNLLTSDTSSITTWGDYAKTQDVHKAAILLSKFAGGSLQVGAEMHKSFVNAGIPTVTINAEPGVLDVAGVVRTIQASGADFITGILDPTEFITIALAARAANPDIKILSLTGYDPQIFLAGKALAGMAVSLGYTPFERPVPAHQTFLNAMAKYAPQQQPAANELALIGWVDTDLMLRGLQAAGTCPTRQSFTTNLRAVTDFSADGLLAKPVNMRTIFGQLSVCYSFLKISNDANAFLPVGKGPICGQLIN